MELTPTYLAGAEKDVGALFKIHRRYWEEPRYQILKKFCADGGNILSVGCGPKEPILIHATHACDITSLSDKFLKQSGWKGVFCIANCTALPYQSKFFDIVVCSEVIEHLPTIQDVIKTFKEVSRLGKKWIITTPNSDVIKPAAQNPGHLQFFVYDRLLQIIPFRVDIDYKIYTHDHHIYIESISNE